MDISAILTSARASGVQISVDGDDLKVLGPTGTITPELIDLLKTHKRDVRAHLLRASPPRLAATRERWADANACPVSHQQ